LNQEQGKTREKKKLA